MNLSIVPNQRVSLDEECLNSDFRIILAALPRLSERQKYWVTMSVSLISAMLIDLGAEGRGRLEKPQVLKIGSAGRARKQTRQAKAVNAPDGAHAASRKLAQRT